MKVAQAKYISYAVGSIAKDKGEGEPIACNSLLMKGSW